MTTTVGGNCGYSPDCLDTFFRRQEAQGYPIHQAELTGHSFTLRRLAGLPDPFTPATPPQIDAMAAQAERAFAHGACGLSLGLGYAPGSSEEEALALCRVAAAHGRFVAVDTHMRTKSDLYSLVEVLCLARRSGARFLISHFVYQYGEGVEAEAVALARRARAEGIDLWVDSGMYTHWATTIGSALFEPEVMRDNDIRLDTLRMATGEHRGAVLDAALYTHLRAQHPHDTVVVRVDNDEAVYTILREPFVMPSSDAGRYRPGEGHPQIAGTFPRFFRKLVAERGELTWLEAVTRATLLPARTVGLADRGRLCEGAVADLLVFDPASLRDHACYVGLGRPDAPPDGIRHVVVAGQHALADGQVLCASAGRALRFGADRSASRT